LAGAARITKRVVDRLEPNSIVWDSEVRGFAARRQRRDVVYILKFRVHGRRRFYTIGLHGAPWTPDTARAEAQHLLGQIAKGTDPAAVRSSLHAAPTFDAFADVYLQDHSDTHKKPATAKAERGMLVRYVRPAIGARKIADIDRGEIARLHASLKSTPVMANRVLALVSHIMSVAIDKGERPEGSNPARKIKKFAESRRERFLTADEIHRLGAAIEKAATTGIEWVPHPSAQIKHAPAPVNRRVAIGEHAAAALRLLLFTGARLREILNLKWEHVDLERGVLLLPDSKTGKKTIVLNAPALEILSTLSRVSAFVVAGKDSTKPRADLNRPWALVRNEAGLTGVRIHDLRHTFASYGAGASLGLPIVGRLLGHSQPATTARYAHLETDPVRRAANTIGSAISAALRGKKPGEIVPLRDTNAA